MASYLKPEVVLVRYVFTDLSGVKIRPGVVVSTSHPSRDLMIVPLTSRVSGLQPGEFVLSDWKSAGLNVISAVKRGIYTVEETSVLKRVGKLVDADLVKLEQSLRGWLGLP